MPRLISFLAAVLIGATTVPLPPLQGFVTDTTGRVSPEARQKMTHLIEELQQKTGAEIAVLVVETTAPLDDFTYAMQVADTWKPGRKRDDTGVVVLLALKDRKLRIVTGYGVEGILPDGLVGEIEDREMLPALKSGDVDGALWGGVVEIARRIAAEHGVTLTGLPAPRAAPQGAQIPPWVIVLAFVAIVIGMQMLGGRGGRGGPLILGGGGGRRDGGFHGGFGGGGGGFGGFGGGGFGGGGAGRSW